jgi:hypothetical protein
VVVTFVLLTLKVIMTILLGWASASRLGYGGIGWRSRRATKQILGIVGCLLLLFSTMLEFEGTPILPLDQFISKEVSTELLRAREQQYEPMVVAFTVPTVYVLPMPRDSVGLPHKWHDIDVRCSNQTVHQRVFIPYFTNE